MNEETTAERTAENSGEGNITSTPTLIERADSAAKRMEEANKKSEELLARHESILARNMLSGRAEAGTIQKSPEQTEKEMIDKQVAETMKRFSR